MSNYPRFQRARSFKTARIITADTSVQASTAGTYQDFPTPARQTIVGQSGDQIEVMISAALGTETGGSGTSMFRMRPYTYVGSTKTTIVVPTGPAWSATSPVVPGNWLVPTNIANVLSGATWYILQPQDIVNSTVTVGLEFTQDVIGAQSMWGTNAIAQWTLKNLGPPEQVP